MNDNQPTLVEAALAVSERASANYAQWLWTKGRHAEIEKDVFMVAGTEIAHEAFFRAPSATLNDIALKLRWLAVSLSGDVDDQTEAALTALAEGDAKAALPLVTAALQFLAADIILTDPEYFRIIAAETVKFAGGKITWEGEP
jgi:hypothetical protein